MGLKGYYNTEKKKLQGMTKEQKKEYIFMYYKVHIGAAIFLAFVIWYIIYHNFINPPPEEFSSVITINNNNVSQEVYDGFSNEIVTQVGLSTKDYIVPLKNLDDEDPLTSPVNTVYYHALMATHDLDIIICPESYLQSGYEQAGVSALTAYYTEEELQKVEEDLYYVNDVPVALNIEGNEFLESYNIITEGMYLCIPINNDNVENTKTVVQIILGVYVPTENVENVENVAETEETRNRRVREEKSEE